MNWTCAQIEDRLSDYLDRLLEPAERIAFEAHKLECANCKKLVDQVIRTVSKVHVLEQIEPPVHLAYAILDKTLGPRAAKVSGWRTWLTWTEFVWQPKFAMGVASVAMSAIVVFTSLGVDFRSITAKDLYPMNLYHSADRQAHMIYARGAKFINDLRVVYEIQSRLQPDTRPGQPPETQPVPPAQNPEKKTEPGRERNRAEDLNTTYMLMASVMNGLPGRSIR
ncbi:MAG: zf-HC2 domain-containing protein [Acidobacteria bacterium]|nr:zf-HC2 domain-containing protein [Acidobacteriota bacterium]